MKIRVTRSRTKRPREALLQLGIDSRLSMRRIGGRLGDPVCGLGGAAGEIPPFAGFRSNLFRESGRGTVPGGQFDWGGRLLKCNGGVQRSSQGGWKSPVECIGIRGLDCETYKSSRWETRAK